MVKVVDVVIVTPLLAVFDW
jgi:hypothetical protein